MLGCRIPQSSQWIDFQDYVAPRLGRSDRRLRVIVEGQQAGSNILTIPAIREMFDVKQALESVSTTYQGSTHTLRDICWKDSTGMCRVLGIMEYFNGNETYFNVLAADGLSEVLAAVNAKDLPDGTSAAGVTAFAGQSEDASGNVTRSSLITWVRFLV